MATRRVFAQYGSSQVLIVLENLNTFGWRVEISLLVTDHQRTGQFDIMRRVFPDSYGFKGWAVRGWGRGRRRRFDDLVQCVELPGIKNVVLALEQQVGPRLIPDGLGEEVT